MRIRILDPHWEKMDPDPGHFVQIYWMILTKQNFQIICHIFSLIFMLKLYEPLKNQEIFYNLSFFNSSDFGFMSKKFLFAVLGRYYAPWIRILSTVFKYKINISYLFKTSLLKLEKKIEHLKRNQKTVLIFSL